MKADEFRKLALELPGAEEGAHQGHPDFRVGGKIFATLGPDAEDGKGDERWGMIKLTPDLQSLRVTAEPKAFEPIQGAWGRQGCTRVLLASARKPSVRQALLDAWRATAPKRLLKEFDER